VVSKLPKTAEKKAADAEPLKLKVFRLEHHNPQSVMLAAHYLIHGPQSGAGVGVPGGGMAGIGGIGGIGGAVLGGGVPGAQLGGLGMLGLGGGFGLAGGPMPGLGGFAGGVTSGRLLAQAFGMAGGPPPVDHAVDWTAFGKTKVVADPRSKTLLARGPERDLQVIADLVTVLNGNSRKPLPKVKNLHVFKLKYADPEEVATAVLQLGIEARATAFPPTPESDEDQPRLLIARGTDEQIREIRQVVEAMDVRSRDEEQEGAP
jgi:hypothetical protein